MKRIVTLLLAAGLVFSAATAAQAIEFKAKGQWLMGFSVGESNPVNKTRGSDGVQRKADADDMFSAAQRVRLALTAVANENLSGTVQFEIGTSQWGKSGNSGALGADDTCIKVKHAYLDWAIPDTDLQVRMGIQGVTMPNFAGGSAVLDDDVAGVVASYKFNENVGVTLGWYRPWNDNYVADESDTSGNNKNNYLDNIDLISLAVPLNFDGVELTPWIMYGIIGQNAMRDSSESSGYASGWWGGSFAASFNDSLRWGTDATFERNSSANTSAFWAGLPVKVSMLDPLNIEFDINYGYIQSYGRGDIQKSDGNLKRYDTKREGWLAKALVEYKMDWGTPGIFGWYASGDDDNPKNGSERMPSISACGTFTSFMGDGNWGWSSGGNLYDRNLAYAGTWGIGIQIRDVSFLENLTHTFRVAYWGGTNDPEMAKFAAEPWSFGSDYEGYSTNNDLYLTKNDSLLEFNLVNSYQMYENFEINLELGYVANFMDEDTWKKSNGGRNGHTFDKQDLWKAQLIFAYTF